MTSLQDSHLLKFVIKGKPVKTFGVKCCPQQTYGVSEQSPDHFKNKHSLTKDTGYIYEHDDKPEFDYFSQKKYFSIDGSGNENFHETYRERVKDGNNRHSFHRKKGRLTEFMDKNAWMAGVTPLMGFERSPQARQCEIRERKMRINSLKPKRVYENKLYKGKVRSNNQKYFETISEMMGEKLRIRGKRNELAGLQVPIIAPKTARQTFSATIENHEREAVESKMMTTMKDWTSANRTTRSSFYKNDLGSSKRVSRGRALSQLTQRQSEPRTRRGGNNQNEQDIMEKFNRTSCNTKWVYKKSPKLDTDESQDDVILK